MDQPLYLLMGAGALIVIIAFLMRRPRHKDAEVQPVQTQMDRAEMEKSLQRFVQQIKQENEAVLADLGKTKSEAREEISALRLRLEKSEQEMEKLAAMISSIQTGGVLPRETSTELGAAEGEPDILALRERYRRVFELKQDGLSIDEIAKRLGAGQGEIELIFSLASPHERGNADA